MAEYNNTENLIKVILAGVYETDVDSGSQEEFEHSMDELSELARACYFKPAAKVTQQLEHRTSPLYMGSGKVEEIAQLVKTEEAELVIFNDTLTPVQIRNLSKEMGVPVMDRTALILEIFKDRARTREAKLQVELARLQYMKPRLIGMWEKQNRQGGASGSMSSKGEGETQLEIDRRMIDHRLSELRKELKIVERERQTQRKKRQSSRMPLVSLVGYTNAGKSTIMNSFVERYADGEKKVFEANMLFATLDTTIRRIETGNNKDFLLSDTVGFIQKLPTGLVEAFKSTLEEVKDADLIIQVVDFSDPHYKDHMITTENTVSELGAGDIPMLVVYNKADLCDEHQEYPRKASDVRDASGRLNKCIVISAKEDASIEFLKDSIIETAFSDYIEATFMIPFNKGNIVAYLQENSHVVSQEYTADGTMIRTRCHVADRDKYSEFLQI
ncbi:MAG: GTPase HflX [Lachnospiraceae bacterium]|nr:GTPase HflX [Lachnospiraceae bacterium]